VWRAAGRLGIPVQAGTPAVEAGLAEFGVRVQFRHPLVRPVAYRSASFAERRQLHAALAEATDPQADPDRRAWHRAQAASGPDEEVAAEFERSAGRAQARGGLAAAAAFFERSVLLTVDPVRHAERALAAAQANMQAGAFDRALELLVTAEAGSLDEFVSARVDLLRGQIVFASSLGSDASSLLLKAAKRLASLDLDLARETYLSAWMAALFAGRLATAGDLLEVCRGARALPPPVEPLRTVDLVLEGLALIVTDGPVVAAPALQRAVNAFVNSDITLEEAFRWGWLAQAAASALWDDDAWRVLLVRQVRLARAAGALDGLITNDKFCCVRRLRLSLTWWRRPLRLRASVLQTEVALSGEPDDPDPDVDRLPAAQPAPRRRAPVGSGLSAAGALGVPGRGGLPDADRRGGA